MLPGLCLRLWGKPLIILVRRALVSTLKCLIRLPLPPACWVWRNPWPMLETIETGAGGSWSLSNLGRRMLKGDYAPGFYIKHFLKDMRIAIESAEEAGLELPGLLKTKELYDMLSAKGMDDNGTQAIIKWYLEK